MELRFKSFKFNIKDDFIRLLTFGDVAFPTDMPFVEVHIAGAMKDSHHGIKLTASSEGGRLKYESHELTDNTLTVTQRSDLIRTKTVFSSHGGSGAVRIHTEIENVSDGEVMLEEASAFVLTGIGKNGIYSANDLYFTRFTQSHYAECQPERRSFFDFGLFSANNHSQKRLAHANIGSWSTKEALPQGIIEDGQGRCIFFAIESSSSWYYEIADNAEKYYLWLGGASLPFGGWSKPLAKGECYRTPSVLLACGNDVDEVLGEVTKHRRAIAKRSDSDLALPTIFNEYMHLSWDSPTEENTRRVAPTVANLGVKYYVIDCGWHNEEPGNIIYPYVGQWKESHARFPSGLRKTTDFIRSLGMKPGLWIEPEIIGFKCAEMLDYYTDDCFLTRHGKRISVMGRYFLDYRCARVREYMSESIRRMVEDYGAEYIKFDYNQDIGIGSDKGGLTHGEGLEDATRAFFSWVDEVTERFPGVIFEGCSSGGMRMDGNTVSHFSLISTSDQIAYTSYPYIAANVLSAVIPEQAAVWSYPVTVDNAGIFVFDKSADWVEKNISDDKIAMNMINSFLGRMHLASHIEKMSEHQLSLVREGIEYYNSISPLKSKSTPVFPIGFTHYGADVCASGFCADGVTYLAVWNLCGDNAVEIPLKNEIKEAKIAYPRASAVTFCTEGNKLCVRFTSSPQAVFFEIK